MLKYHNHHIQPKRMGGTDDPSNLIKLTIAEHAAWHYELWVYYGQWQDYIAWKCLSGEINQEEKLLHIHQRNGHKVGKWNKNKPKKSEHKLKLQKILNNGHFHATKQYIAISPEGQTELVFHLKDFCNEYNLTYNSMKVMARTLAGKQKQGKIYQHKGWVCFIP